MLSIPTADGVLVDMSACATSGTPSQQPIVGNRIHILEVGRGAFGRIDLVGVAVGVILVLSQDRKPYRM
jgi:hypothetical protein